MSLPRIPSRDGRRALLRSRPYQLVLAILVLTAVGLGLGLTLGLRSPAGSQSPSTELAPLLREAGPLVVFSEFGMEADTLWAAGPDDPSERAELARVQHAPGFGISPSLSPDGARIAYTAVAPNVVAAGPDAPAELWVLDIETGATTRLAEGVDLQITPVWSRGGDAVVARRSESPEDAEGSFELLRIDLSGAVTSLVGGSQGLFPIDFSPDGRALYYASISPAGTDLASVPALGGAPEAVAHLSDGFGRDWELSPDGTRLAYLAQAPSGANAAFLAEVLDISTGAAERPIAEAVDQFGPVWEPDGSLTVGRVDSGDGGAQRLNPEGAPLPALRGAGRGFDVPLSWSPDSRHLAVRAFEGSSVDDPGPSRVVVVSKEGERRELSRLSDVEIAGWMQPPA